MLAHEESPQKSRAAGHNSCNVTSTSEAQLRHLSSVVLPTSNGKRPAAARPRNLLEVPGAQGGDRNVGLGFTGIPRVKADRDVASGAFGSLCSEKEQCFPDGSGARELFAGTDPQTPWGAEFVGKPRGSQISVNSGTNFRVGHALEESSECSQEEKLGRRVLASSTAPAACDLRDPMQGSSQLTWLKSILRVFFPHKPRSNPCSVETKSAIGCHNSTTEYFRPSFQQHLVCIPPDSVFTPATNRNFSDKTTECVASEQRARQQRSESICSTEQMTVQQFCSSAADPASYFSVSSRNSIYLEHSRCVGSFVSSSCETRSSVASIASTINPGDTWNQPCRTGKDAREKRAARGTFANGAAERKIGRGNRDRIGSLSIQRTEMCFRDVETRGKFADTEASRATAPDELLDAPGHTATASETFPLAKTPCTTQENKVNVAGFDPRDPRAKCQGGGQQSGGRATPAELANKCVSASLSSVEGTCHKGIPHSETTGAGKEFRNQLVDVITARTKRWLETGRCTSNPKCLSPRKTLPSRPSHEDGVLHDAQTSAPAGLQEIFSKILPLGSSNESEMARKVQSVCMKKSTLVPGELQCTEGDFSSWTSSPSAAAYMPPHPVPPTSPASPALVSSPVFPCPREVSFEAEYKCTGGYNWHEEDIGSSGKDFTSLNATSYLQTRRKDVSPTTSTIATTITSPTKSDTFTQTASTAAGLQFLAPASLSVGRSPAPVSVAVSAVSPKFFSVSPLAGPRHAAADQRYLPLHSHSVFSASSKSIPPLEDNVVAGWFSAEEGLQEHAVDAAEEEEAKVFSVVEKVRDAGVLRSDGSSSQQITPASQSASLLQNFRIAQASGASQDARNAFDVPAVCSPKKMVEPNDGPANSYSKDIKMPGNIPTVFFSRTTVNSGDAPTVLSPEENVKLDCVPLFFSSKEDVGPRGVPRISSPGKTVQPDEVPAVLAGPVAASVVPPCNVHPTLCARSFLSTFCNGRERNSTFENRKKDFQDITSSRNGREREERKCRCPCHIAREDRHCCCSSEKLSSECSRSDVGCSKGQEEAGDAGTCKSQLVYNMQKESPGCWLAQRQQQQLKVRGGSVFVATQQSDGGRAGQQRTCAVQRRTAGCEDTTSSKRKERGIYLRRSSWTLCSAPRQWLKDSCTLQRSSSFNRQERSRSTAKAGEKVLEEDARLKDDNDRKAPGEECTSRNTLKREIITAKAAPSAGAAIATVIPPAAASGGPVAAVIIPAVDCGARAVAPVPGASAGKEILTPVLAAPEVITQTGAVHREVEASAPIAAGGRSVSPVIGKARPATTTIRGERTDRKGVRRTLSTTAAEAEKLCFAEASLNWCRKTRCSLLPRRKTLSRLQTRAAAGKHMEHIQLQQGEQRDYPLVWDGSLFGSKDYTEGAGATSYRQRLEAASSASPSYACRSPCPVDYLEPITAEETPEKKTCRVFSRKPAAVPFSGAVVPAATTALSAAVVEQAAVVANPFPGAASACSLSRSDITICMDSRSVGKRSDGRELSHDRPSVLSSPLANLESDSLRKQSRHQRAASGPLRGEADLSSFVSGSFTQGISRRTDTDEASVENGISPVTQNRCSLQATAESHVSLSRAVALLPASCSRRSNTVTTPSWQHCTLFAPLPHHNDHKLYSMAEREPQIHLGCNSLHTNVQQACTEPTPEVLLSVERCLLPRHRPQDLTMQRQKQHVVQETLLYQSRRQKVDLLYGLPKGRLCCCKEQHKSASNLFHPVTSAAGAKGCKQRARSLDVEFLQKKNKTSKERGRRANADLPPCNSGSETTRCATSCEEEDAEETAIHHLPSAAVADAIAAAVDPASQSNAATLHVALGRTQNQQVLQWSQPCPYGGHKERDELDNFWDGQRGTGKECLIGADAVVRERQSLRAKVQIRTAANSALDKAALRPAGDQRTLLRLLSAEDSAPHINDVAASSSERRMNNENVASSSASSSEADWMFSRVASLRSLPSSAGNFLADKSGSQGSGSGDLCYDVGDAAQQLCPFKKREQFCETADAFFLSTLERHGEDKITRELGFARRQDMFVPPKRAADEEDFFEDEDNATHVSSPTSSTGSVVFGVENACEDADDDGSLHFGDLLQVPQELHPQQTEGHSQQQMQEEEGGGRATVHCAEQECGVCKEEVKESGLITSTPRSPSLLLCFRALENSWKDTADEVDMYVSPSLHSLPQTPICLPFAVREPSSASQDVTRASQVDTAAAAKETEGATEKISTVEDVSEEYEGVAGATEQASPAAIAAGGRRTAAVIAGDVVSRGAAVASHERTGKITEEQRTALTYRAAEGSAAKPALLGVHTCIGLYALDMHNRSNNACSNNCRADHNERNCILNKEYRKSTMTSLYGKHLKSGSGNLLSSKTFLRSNSASTKICSGGGKTRVTKKGRTGKRLTCASVNHQGLTLTGTLGKGKGEEAEQEERWQPLHTRKPPETRSSDMCNANSTRAPSSELRSWLRVRVRGDTDAAQSENSNRCCREEGGVATKHSAVESCSSLFSCGDGVAAADAMSNSSNKQQAENCEKMNESGAAVASADELGSTSRTAATVLLQQQPLVDLRAEGETGVKLLKTEQLLEQCHQKHRHEKQPSDEQKQLQQLLGHQGQPHGSKDVGQLAGVAGQLLLPFKERGKLVWDMSSGFKRKGCAASGVLLLSQAEPHNVLAAAKGQLADRTAARRAWWGLGFAPGRSRSKKAASGDVATRGATLLTEHGRENVKHSVSSLRHELSTLEGRPVDGEAATVSGPPLTHNYQGARTGASDVQARNMEDRDTCSQQGKTVGNELAFTGLVAANKKHLESMQSDAVMLQVKYSSLLLLPCGGSEALIAGLPYFEGPLCLSVRNSAAREQKRRFSSCQRLLKSMPPGPAPAEHLFYFVLSRGHLFWFAERSDFSSRGFDACVGSVSLLLIACHLQCDALAQHQQQHSLPPGNPTTSSNSSSSKFCEAAARNGVAAVAPVGYCISHILLHFYATVDATASATKATAANCNVRSLSERKCSSSGNSVHLTGGVAEESSEAEGAVLGILDLHIVSEAVFCPTPTLSCHYEDAMSVNAAFAEVSAGDKNRRKSATLLQSLSVCSTEAVSKAGSSAAVIARVAVTPYEAGRDDSRSCPSSAVNGGAAPGCAPARPSYRHSLYPKEESGITREYMTTAPGSDAALRLRFWRRGTLSSGKRSAEKKAALASYAAAWVQHLQTSIVQVPQLAEAHVERMETFAKMRTLPVWCFIRTDVPQCGEIFAVLPAEQHFEKAYLYNIKKYLPVGPDAGY